MATEVQLDRTMLYRAYVILLVGGAIAVLFFLMSTFRTMLDLGTTVAFLVAPVIAVLNHRAVFGPLIPDDARPGRAMQI